MRSAASCLFNFVLCAGAMNWKVVCGLSAGKKPGLSVHRRDFYKFALLGGTGVAYGNLVNNAVEKLSRGISYPSEHEDRVKSTISRTLAESAKSLSLRSRDLRVLEIGIGQEWRTLQRGLYNEALELFNLLRVTGIEIDGIDLKLPSPGVVEQAKLELKNLISNDELSVDAKLVSADLTCPLPFPDGYFDAVVSCLTLCSVSSPIDTLQQVHRVLRPNGGVFGFIEHVAVDPAEPYHFLEWQQRTLDPLQQLVAENCHLHRYTGDYVADVFGIDDDQPKSERIQNERFLVDDMWPISCQTAGVVQRVT